ncbi:hypothetical protein [Leifsonia poae]|uniref:hypothetical protein n=1 Tax=Leifsonia poae TaxID=110933 RepID=UPI003D67D25B
MDASRGDGFVPIDLLGREVAREMDWLAAEELLEERGLGYLAEPFSLRFDDGSRLRVRIVEVSRERIRVKKDDFGDIRATRMDYVLPFPVPAELLTVDTSYDGVFPGP